MALSFCTSRFSTAKASSKDSRQDSAISIQITPLSAAEQDGCATARIELPSPSPPARISPSHRLVKRCHVERHQKTLHELVGSACQTTCSMILRRSILSSGSNLLFTDPAAVDLLLLCVNSARNERGYGKRRLLSLNLLPGCPLSNDKIREVCDGLPELCTFALVPRTAGSTGGTANAVPKKALAVLADNHRTLLKWLLKSSFAHLASLTPISHLSLCFPSLTSVGIGVFVVTRQPPNKESLFKRHSRHVAPFTVFHGTHPSRLPLILSQGLKNMSGTRYMSNGRAMGQGIYLASDAATSLCYSYGAGGWRNSQWRIDGAENCNVKVLLGCELVGEERGKRTYVVPDEGRVVVRFVFVVPGGGAAEPGYQIQGELEEACRVLREMRG
ncbi:hypothetical protein EJ04DRAFT_560671 [Polyplosphaeria fusca]|uniref:PARP catalytic domain-containing protein n=1 Tax=Polyplosphaeria fusca TaxID=682080 RepID=A0A9P4V6C3_9PLEO|nr:hypothetical protein EJ04DRAFT_560671 [Polyplosphaeria fusca]